MSSSTPTPLREILEGTKVSDLDLPTKEVVEVTVDMIPVDAAKKLWENQILGAPVWDESKQKYIGFFDMRDLLSAVVAAHKEGQASNVNAHWFNKEKNKPSFTVSYLCARNPFVSLPLDATLKDVCELFVQKNCSRVCILDPQTGRCSRILSQSSLVKFLADKAARTDKLVNKFEETLDEAGFPYRKDVFAASENTPAREVFELMDSYRLTGVAVVDSEDGALVGNTSATDIKMAVCVEEGPLADLNMNIMSYLAAVRQEQTTKEDKYPSSHVKTSSTLGHAIRLLSKTGFHRVFVVDAELKPVGVISVTDVAKFVVQHS